MLLNSFLKQFFHCKSQSHFEYILFCTECIVHEWADRAEGLTQKSCKFHTSTWASIYFVQQRTEKNTQNCFSYILNKSSKQGSCQTSDIPDKLLNLGT